MITYFPNSRSPSLCGATFFKSHVDLKSNVFEKVTKGAWFTFQLEGRLFLPAIAQGVREELGFTQVKPRRMEKWREISNLPSLSLGLEVCACVCVCVCHVRAVGPPKVPRTGGRQPCFDLVDVEGGSSASTERERDSSRAFGPTATPNARETK